MVSDSKFTFKHPVIHGRVLDLFSPEVMGILNVTPDSFSDGGDHFHPDSALSHIDKMVKEGASIIDIGGESTRPGAAFVPINEELNRVIPVLEVAIPKYQDILFSVDTTKYEVAKAALKRGAHFINDISGLQKEPRLAELCAEYNVPLILMHSKGDPKTMQVNPEYNDVLAEVEQFFKDQIDLARSYDLDNIIIDPGFGFGKTLEHNLKILAHLDRFRSLDYPILVGASRKSMIGAILNGRPASERLAGTLAVHYHAMISGAKIIRAHDVKEAVDTVAVFNSIQQAK